MRLSYDQLKRKLRQLRKLEIDLRFKHRPVPPNPVLVWNVFFSTKRLDDPSVKYPMFRLLQMEREERKEVFSEYFYRVYFQSYQENGLTMTDVYDPRLLSLLGLPPHAGLQEIKGRFRELAKRHHPDHGGDSAQFIELMDVYEQLTHR
jgi:hypothetical protein